MYVVLAVRSLRRVSAVELFALVFVCDDPRLTMKWSSAPLVLVTLLMALVTLAEEVASKNKAGRGRGSKWW